MRSEKPSQCLTAESSVVANWRLSKIKCVILDYMLTTNRSHLITEIMEILEIVIKILSFIWAIKFIAYNKFIGNLG